MSRSGCSICGFEAGPGWVGLRDSRGCSRAFCGYRGESLPDDHCLADLSFDEIAAAAGVEAPRIAPGEAVANVDLGIELYWPGRPPLWGRA